MFGVLTFSPRSSLLKNCYYSGIIYFLDNSTAVATYSVLVFPPFQSKYRYLAHKVIDEFFFPALCSFSIGPDEKRRFIVGRTTVIARCCLPYRCVHDKLEHLFFVEKPVACICSARLKSLKIHPPVRGSSPVTKKRESMKDLKSERGRSAMENKHTDGSDKALKERRKRPDMQRYVPRALRGVENKSVSLKNVEMLNQQDSKKKPQKSTDEASLSNSLDNPPHFSSEQKAKKNSVNMNLTPKSINNDADETVVECSFSAATNYLVNAAPTISTSFPTTKMGELQNFQSTSSCIQTDMPCHSNCTKNIAIVNDTIATISENVTENINEFVIVENIPPDTANSKKEEMYCTVGNAPCKAVDDKTNFTVIDNVSCNALDMKNEVSCTTTTDSCYTSDMDSLNISDKSYESDASLKTAESSKTIPKEKDDSWESKFDDDGECLDSDLVKELSSVTGKIQARAAKNNYTDYQPVTESVPQEYEHIVELYGFPREFVTQDLVSAFSIFQQSSFSIKWVDDCHALAIFTSPSLANQALQMKHPFMKVRPLSEGIKESKAKARWCAHHSEPQKPRPATSAVLARRLVSGALGLRVQATKEQRDHERSVLKEAKEKRRLKAKQKEAIWDGSVI